MMLDLENKNVKYVTKITERKMEIASGAESRILKSNSEKVLRSSRIESESQEAV